MPLEPFPKSRLKITSPEGSSSRETVTVAVFASAPVPAVTVSEDCPTGAAVTVISPSPEPDSGEKASCALVEETVQMLFEVTRI